MPWAAIASGLGNPPPRREPREQPAGEPDAVLVPEHSRPLPSAAITSPTPRHPSGRQPRGVKNRWRSVTITSRPDKVRTRYKAARPLQKPGDATTSPNRVDTSPDCARSAIGTPSTIVSGATQPKAPISALHLALLPWKADCAARGWYSFPSGVRIGHSTAIGSQRNKGWRYALPCIVHQLTRYCQRTTLNASPV
jgi:hypothetical protein